MGKTAERLSSSASGAMRLERSAAPLIVWAIWAAMLAAVLAHIAAYGRNIPLAEDWLLVAPLTGHEPDLLQWLWAQNNEHRVPLPRFVYLLLLHLSGGDFRVGMIANALLLGAVSAAFVLAARRVRGGCTLLPDAFFPIALLHLGNWENLVWSWQLQFVLSTTLVCGMLLIILTQHLPLTGVPAGVGALFLALLPLSGANGLIFAIALLPWFGYAALRGLRSLSPVARRWGGVLLAACAAVLLLTAAYFLGYERATWNPPSPGAAASLRTSALFLALALGPAAGVAWNLAMLAVLATVGVTAVIFLRALHGLRGPERERALGLLLFLGGIAVLTVSIGWGRAGLVPTQGMPDRYTLLAVPALLVVPFLWELYTSGLWRRFVQWGLLFAFLILLPLNLRAGYGWRNWYVAGMTAVEDDLAVGVPFTLLAEKHREFLLHWDQQMLESRMRMLRDAGTGPFRSLAVEGVDNLANDRRGRMRRGEPR